VGQNIVVMFEGFNAGTLGNNLFLDNINIDGVPGEGLPTANFSAANTTICAGESVQFNDQSAPDITSRTWTFPGGNPGTSSSANPIIAYNNPGTYSVTLSVSNANGTNTSTQSNLVVVNPAPSTPTITQNGNVLSVFLQLGESATWFLNGNQIGTGANLTITNQGNYTVEVTNSFGCRAVSGTFNVLSNEDLELNNILIFPNPNQGKFIIQLDNHALESITIVDAIGRTVAQISTSDVEVHMDLSHLNSGLYSVVLRTANGILVRKIEILK
jgi:hypothetical protein